MAREPQSARKLEAEREPKRQQERQPQRLLELGQGLRYPWRSPVSMTDSREGREGRFSFLPRTGIHQVQSKLGRYLAKSALASRKISKQMVRRLQVSYYRSIALYFVRVSSHNLHVDTLLS